MNFSRRIVPGNSRRRRVGVARIGQTLGSLELRKFLAGTFAWGTAHQMVIVAQTYVITELTGSTRDLAILAGVIALVSVSMGFIGGILADRVSRQALLMLGSVATSAAMLAIGVLLVVDRIEPWHIQLAGAIQGASLAFDWTARFALLPNMVDRKILPRSISFDLTIFNLTRISAPLIWGWIIILSDAEWPYFVMSSLFLCNVILVWSFKPKPQAKRSSHPPIWEDVSEIAKIVTSNPIVAGNMIFTAVNALLLGGFVYLLAPFAKNVLTIGPSGLGHLFTAIGFGAFAGALTLGISGGARRMGYMLLITNMFVAGFAMLFALVAEFYLGLAIALLFGMFNAIHVGMGTISLQVAVSDDVRGRLAGIYEIAWAGFPLGGFVFAILAGFIGISEALLIGGAFVALVTLMIGLFNSSLRRFTYRG